MPWADIEAVVLWQHFTAALKPMRYVGLRRRPGAPALPGANASLSWEQASSLAPHVDHDLFLSSRCINLWRLDRERLVHTVRAIAPHVPVEEIPDPS
ncbi:hypothetical protein AB0L85_08370 [Streptomyces sp. NPDC052051]|uniref:hypothetical protein n=1 Tax=Streptomyces sp. NPDC052051 TaxID=3154649 RepID=UPI0034187812